MGETPVYIAKTETLGPKQSETLRSFKSYLEEALGPNNSVSYLTVDRAANLSDEKAVVVTLGKSGLEAVARGKGLAPVIATFLSDSSYESAELNSGRPITAIFSNPNPAFQVALLKSFYGDAASFAFFTTSDNTRQEILLLQAAERLAIPYINIKEVDTKSIRSQFEEIKGKKAIILIDDDDLYKRVSLEKFLTFGYDINNMGIIGYSSRIVKSGALATTFSSEEDIAKSVADFIRNYEKSSSLPEKDYSTYFSVEINKYVARSLDLPERSENEVKTKVKEILSKGAEK
jgi:ABC-type uncharacterized transport system substrate-binding protein